MHKVVLITGAAKRVGAALANYFHAHNHHVIVHYRQSKSNAEKLVVQFNQTRSRSAAAIYADLDQFDHYQKLIHESIAIFGRLDVLINNASTFFKTPVGSATEKDWDLLINSNLKAPFFLSQAAAPQLSKQQGCIINMVDIHAQSPMKNYPIYSCAKAGLCMLTQSLAIELAPRVRVNAIAPGHVMWPTDDTAFSEDEKNKIMRA